MKTHPDQLAKEMKNFEFIQTNRKVIPGLPIYVRLDGRCFSAFTKEFKKPFDLDFINLMIKTTEYLHKEFNCSLSYTQSDEINLLLKPSSDFDGKYFKLISVICSACTSYFTKNLPSHMFKNIYPTFDCRVFNFPDKCAALSCFKWRYLDATKNSLNSLSTFYFLHTDLLHLNSKQLKRKLLIEKQVKFNSLASCIKFGVFICNDLDYKNYLIKDLGINFEAFKY